MKDASASVFQILLKFAAGEMVRQILTRIMHQADNLKEIRSEKLKEETSVSFSYLVAHASKRIVSDFDDGAFADDRNDDHWEVRIPIIKERQTCQSL